MKNNHEGYTFQHKKGTGSALAWKASLLLLLGVFMMGAAPEKEVITIICQNSQFIPNEIHVKKGVTTVLQFTSLDRDYGFYCPAFNRRTDIVRKKISSLRIRHYKTGVFEFHCDVPCGPGHRFMKGIIIVEELPK